MLPSSRASGGGGVNHESITVLDGSLNIELTPKDIEIFIREIEIIAEKLELDSKKFLKILIIELRDSFQNDKGGPGLGPVYFILRQFNDWWHNKQIALLEKCYIDYVIKHFYRPSSTSAQKFDAIEYDASSDVLQIEGASSEELTIYQRINSNMGELIKMHGNNLQTVQSIFNSERRVPIDVYSEEFIKSIKSDIITYFRQHVNREDSKWISKYNYVARLYKIQKYPPGSAIQNANNAVSPFLAEFFEIDKPAIIRSVTQPYDYPEFLIQTALTLDIIYYLHNKGTIQNENLLQKFKNKGHFDSIKLLNPDKKSIFAKKDKEDKFNEYLLNLINELLKDYFIETRIPNYNYDEFYDIVKGNATHYLSKLANVGTSLKDSFKTGANAAYSGLTASVKNTFVSGFRDLKHAASAVTNTFGVPVRDLFNSGLTAASNARNRYLSTTTQQEPVFVPMPEHLIERPGPQSGVNEGLDMQYFNPQSPGNVFPSTPNQGSTFTPSPLQNSSYVRTPTAPENSSFGSAARPENSRFASNRNIVECTVTFYFNDKIITRFNRPDNTYLMGDISTPLETFKHQQFLGSYDTFDQNYDVIVPMQGGEIIQNAAQSTLRQLINLQQPGSNNLNVTIKEKPQQPNTNPFSSVSSSNSYDNSASAASGGGGAAVEKEDLLLDGDFNYEPINIFGQQIIFSEDEKYENISGKKIYELFITEFSLQGMQFNDSSFQQFFKQYNSKQLFDFYHYLIIEKGYAYVSNPNYDFTINENGHIELFVKIVYKEKVQDYLKYDVYENNWTNLHTTKITNKKINDITKKTKEYINGGAYVRKMIEFLWKILFVMETSPHNIALMQQDVGQSVNAVGPGGGATSKSKAPALSKMKLEDLKPIAEKNGINTIGKTQQQIYEELQKLKKDKKLIYGGSKTRKRRNKRTHRVKPRKLMSRRQKYSRRK